MPGLWPDQRTETLFNRHSYDPEKRQALDAWARKLEHLLTRKTGAVVALRKAG